MPAKNADHGDAAAGLGNGLNNRSASHGIHPEQTIATTAAATRATPIEAMHAWRMLMIRCRRSRTPA
jgi:hypothetical protein